MAAATLIEPTRHTLKDGRTITVRSAEPTDAPALLQQARETLLTNDFATREADEFLYTVEEEASLIERHRQSPGMLWLVAEADGKIVGSVIFTHGSTRRTAHAGAFGIGLSQAWRGQGLGSIFMQRLLDWAEREPSVEKVGLAVFATNAAAIALYKKFGFAEEGRRIRHIKLAPGHYVDDILMYRWVKPPTP